jgi:hypothetical protein
MLIAVLSDIHDNIWNLRAAFTSLQDADLLLCCGDLCSPFVIPILAENFAKPIHMVYGNNDGDLLRMSNNARRYPNFSLEGELYQAEFDGLRFAVNHYDNIGLEIARSGLHDVVCFGHNHRWQVEWIGQTLVINPGALMGFGPLDRHDVAPTFVVFDTQDKAVATYQVKLPPEAHRDLVVVPFDSRG